MGIFEKLGLTRSKARPVGGQLERGRPKGESTRRNLLVKVGIFAGLLVITLLAFPRGELTQYTVQVGDTWQRQMLAAPYDFPIHKAEETLERERRAAREGTPPYFREASDAQQQMSANRDTLAQQLARVFEAYAEYRRHQQQGQPLAAARDSLRYLELRRTTRGLTLTPAQWRTLARSYVERRTDLLAPEEQAGGLPLHEELLREAWELGTQFLNIGVMNIPRDTVHTDEVVIRNEAERIDRRKAKDNLYGLDEAYETARSQFGEAYPNQPERADLAAAFFRAIFQPSLEYMRAETLREQRQQMQAVAPTRGVVQRGEVIVSRGDRVTSDIKRKLTSLERAESERSGHAIVWKQIAGEFILCLATYLIFFLYLFFLRRRVFHSNRAVLLIALLFLVIIGLFAAVVRLPSVGLYVVPVAIASVQLTILFDSRVGLFGTLTLALIGGFILGFDLEYAFATFFAGTLGVFSVRDIKNRGQYFLSGGLVFLGYLVVLAATWLLFNTPTDRLFTDIGLVAANSLFVVMAYPLLWLFERAFDISTDLTLLELSDTNRKLLKELSLRAPGSFNHSLQVANLAEAAADTIGANALLARVGALYHDIGKMLKPEYYAENQRTGTNPHDKLKPRMSALIIASHVKEGLEMGRQHNLPRRVLDFIPMHHGTTRIEFFYRKALEEKAPADPDVLESEFRYPGPRPNSRETGILMLADSVEAASRTIEEPTHKRLEHLINAIFDARIDDGQLDDTDLTFRDLNRIRETFLSMLMGIYHVRVKYPDQEEEEEESAEEEKAPALEERSEAEESPPPFSDAIRSRMEEQGMWGTPEQAVPVRRAEDAEEPSAAQERDERSAKEASSNGAADSLEGQRGRDE